MLDDLLGRTALKEEIAALEAEVESLENQLEAEQERRADAVTDRQTAQERANRLEDRVEELEDRVMRLQDEETEFTYRWEEQLTGRRLAAVLERLESVETGPECALSAYIPDGHVVPGEVRELLGERASLVGRAAPCLVYADDAGLVSACLRPPVEPEPFVEWDEQFTIDRAWLQPRGRYTLALVRSDLFAMGTYQGDERVAFHGFDSALKSQHSKGGFSQSRFERLRDEQIDDHIERSLTALEERDADPLYVVGESSVLNEFESIAAASAPVSATGDPEPALDDAFQAFWSVPLRVV